MNQKSDFTKTPVPDSSCGFSWEEGGGVSGGVGTRGDSFVSIAIPFLSCGVLCLSSLSFAGRECED